MVQKIATYKRGIGAFIASEKGQRFFNFAYSIGAAVVIWGALFKILHLPGGNTLLSLGMGTEVLMFLLTAFDRPPKEYDWEKVYPALRDQSEDAAAAAPATPVPGSSAVATAAPFKAVNTGASADASSATADYLECINSLTAEMRTLQQTTAALNSVSATLLESYRAITENSAAITSASEGYVTQMADLHRNISGLNTIYELQLRGVSSQIESIDRVNRGIKDIRDMYEKSATQSARYCEETERMARYMQQLNSVYEKMLTAMTVNMYRPGIDGIPVHPEAHNGRQGSAAEAPVAEAVR